MSFLNSAPPVASAACASPKPYGSGEGLPAPVILQVIPELQTGGAELSTIEIAEALTRAGARALVASAGGRMEAALAEAGGELIRLPLASKNPAILLANARRLARLVRSHGVALIHARSRAPAWSALLAARMTRRPFVTTYHGAYNQRSRLKSWYNSVMARGDLVIANSAYTADLVRTRHGVAPARLRIIPRGVDIGQFDPARVSGARVARLRKLWGLGDDERAVLQLARLTRWKGQDLLIEAAAQLARAGQQGGVVFILAGDAQGRADYEAELLALIAARGLEGRVRLVGHCDDVPAACLAADLVVIASREPEAFGRTAVEAQAMGRPVIAARLGAVAETIAPMPEGAVDVPAPGRGGESPTGWLIRPDDAGALASALDDALSLPEDTLAQMGAQGRTRVLTHFTREQMQRATLSVYDELLGSTLAGRL